MFLRNLEGLDIYPTFLSSMRFVNGRLYLSTRNRVLVLSPTGELLQTYNCSPHLPGGSHDFRELASMKVVEGKLILWADFANGDGLAIRFALRGL